MILSRRGHFRAGGAPSDALTFLPSYSFTKLRQKRTFRSSLETTKWREVRPFDIVA